MTNIILASKSPRRKMLLEQIHVPFSIEPSDYEEDMTLDMKPQELAKFLAFNKALSVANKHKNEDAIVIGADTFIVFNDELMGKARSEDQAREMLQKISSKTHEVVTGLAVINTKETSKPQISSVAEAVISKVWFAELTKKDITDYIATGEPLGKAAAYAIQGYGSQFVTKVEGSYSAIVGLPLHELRIRLQKML